jgi:biotin carboxyl carrier protein
MVRAVAVANSLSYQLLVNGKRCTIEVNSEREMLMKRFGGTSETRGCQSDIIAPMPALVVKINVAVGDHVRNGQGIVVLEAMKMENEIRCPSDGIVQEVLVVTGQAVEKGELLVRLG